MNVKPKISVVLPVRNGGHGFKTAVDSILAQTWQDYELLVIDDGSTDGCLEYLKSLHDARIRLFSDGRNCGLSYRLNEGISVARGSYICRMDADDIAFPKRLQLQVAYLEAHEDVDLVGGRAIVFRKSGNVGLLPFAATHEELCAKPWDRIPIPHPTWMARREWHLKHPYKHPEVLRAEDQDLLIRAYPTSRYACLPDVVLGYRQGGYDLRKTMIARWQLLKAQLSIFLERSEWWFALLACLITLLKVAFDLMASLPSMEWLFFRRMNAGVSKEAEEILDTYRRLEER